MYIVSFANYGFTNGRQQALNGLLKLVMSLLMTTGSVLAQGDVKNLLFYEPDKTVYTVVEKQPEFPGGFDAMKEYLLTNVIYPPAAQKAGIKGRVFTSFVVEVDGSITQIQLLKGIGYGCDEEALRVISAMPRWTPGSQSGKPLRVKSHLPVLFGIDYPKPKRH